MKNWSIRILPKRQPTRNKTAPEDSLDQSCPPAPESANGMSLLQTARDRTAMLRQIALFIFADSVEYKIIAVAAVV